MMSDKKNSSKSSTLREKRKLLLSSSDYCPGRCETGRSARLNDPTDPTNENCLILHTDLTVLHHCTSFCFVVVFHMIPDYKELWNCNTLCTKPTAGDSP